MSGQRTLVAAAILVTGLCSCQLALGSSTRTTSCLPIRAGGHTYGVAATNVKCAFARKWATKLAGKRLGARALLVRLSGGPAGYTCRAGTKLGTTPLPTIAKNVQVSGNCAKGPGGVGSFGGSPYFNWIVKTTS